MFVKYAVRPPPPIAEEFGALDIVHVEPSDEVQIFCWLLLSPTATNCPPHQQRSRSPMATNIAEI
jgi:hypothetical protein